MKNNQQKKKFKIEISQRYINLFISFVVVVILFISATVAWFVYQGKVQIDGFSGKISNWDFIVSKESMGEPISDDETITLNMEDFSNVSENMLAPGTYGTFDLYVRSSSEVVTQVNVFLDKSTLKFVIPDENLQDVDYSAILLEHFRFYSDENFENEITLTNPLVETLERDQEKKITIYFRWAYDGSEVMPETITDPEEIEAYLKQYDVDDMFIADNQDYISGVVSILVTGTQEIVSTEQP